MKKPTSLDLKNFKNAQINGLTLRGNADGALGLVFEILPRRAQILEQITLNDLLKQIGSEPKGVYEFEIHYDHVSGRENITECPDEYYQVVIEKIFNPKPYLTRILKDSGENFYRIWLDWNPIQEIKTKN